MEQGPEPNELMEHVEQSHHAYEHLKEMHEPESKRFVMRTAITASVLAVGAAIASLLAGHAANEAILKQTQAADQWAYYQAQSTKSHVFEGNKALLSALAATGNKQEGTALKGALQSFDTKIATYDSEKAKIKGSAEDLERESALEALKDRKFAAAVVWFQIGIVLASITLLAENRKLYWLSVGSGCIGVVFALIGFIK